MKIRNGFVSNSSSSSFLLGIGKIENEEKVNELIDNFKHYGATIDIIDNVKVPFMYCNVDFNPNLLQYKKEDKLFTIEYYGDEGDDYFYDYVSDEMDYDFNYEDLDVKIHDFIENIKPFLSNFQITVGAQRIG